MVPDTRLQLLHQVTRLDPDVLEQQPDGVNVDVQRLVIGLIHQGLRPGTHCLHQAVVRCDLLVDNFVILQLTLLFLQ